MSYFSDHEDNYEDENYDYDYYGPNSEFHQQFDEPNSNKLPEGNIPVFSPEEPVKKLADIKRENLENYHVIMSILCKIAINRNKRMMRIFRESAGAEKHLQVIEADLDAGNCQLMNTVINGVFRTCLFDFNPFSGVYELSLDNV